MERIASRRKVLGCLVAGCIAPITSACGGGGSDTAKGSAVAASAKGSVAAAREGLHNSFSERRPFCLLNPM